MADLIPAEKPETIPVVVVRRERPQRFEMIDLLDGLSCLMDRCFEVPGSRFRFGINSFLLLLPGLGDAIASMISLFILSIALGHYRVPRIVAARMVINWLLDSAISSLPVVGNLWDVWFKADTRNVNLLRPYVSDEYERPPSTWGHWVFVGGVLLLFVAALALVAWGMVALAVLAVRGLQAHEA
jgi:hypothetical protein